MQEITPSEQNGIVGADHGAKRAPGRPRNERSRQAILRSTLKLLRRAGFGDLSIEAIAADARVGKATVYRWWPNKGALVVDAFASSIANELHFPDSGSVQEAYQTLQRGIDRAELPKGLNLDLVLDLLYGAIYMRFLIRHDELDEQYVNDICRVILEGVVAQSRNGRRKPGRPSSKPNPN
jgi:AcrR family transcriptional regulator